MQKIKKYLEICLAILMSCLLIKPGVPTYANQDIGSITLLFGTVDMSGAQFGLYKVADVKVDKENEKYIQTDKFEDYEFNFNSFLPEPNASLNQQVEDYVVKNKIKTDEIQTVPANKDRVVFTNLDRGLYFIRLLNKSANTPKATMNSFLISLPQLDPNIENKEYWHVTSESKMSLVTPDPDKQDPTPQSPISNSSSKNTSTTTNTSSDKVSRSSSTKTGQETNLWLYLGLSLVAVIIISILISRLRRAR